MLTQPRWQHGARFFPALGTLRSINREQLQSRRSPPEIPRFPALPNPLRANLPDLLAAMVTNGRASAH